LEAGPPREFQLYRSSNSKFFFDYGDADGVVDRVVPYGAPGDIGMLADVDGDTVADLILYRPSNGAWFIDLFNNGTVDQSFFLGGAPGDLPVVGDFLGTGKAGFGIYRPSTGTWYLDQDGNGTVDHISAFGGAAGDKPVVADYDGDGKADCAIYRSGTWFVDFACDGTLDAIYYLGGLPQDVPIAADFDGDWKADNAVFRDGIWYIDYGNNTTVDRTVSYGAPGDRPLFAGVNPAGVFVKAGAVGGTGTQTNPFGSIAGAMGAVVDPNPATIRIGAGTYNQAVSFSSRHNLTFFGAGVNATHIQPAAGDSFVAVSSLGIVLRNLHVASTSASGNRAVIAQGSGMTLDRVSTFNNRSHNVLGVGPNATLTIQNSNLNASQVGNGLVLQGGVTALVQRSTIDGNGTVLPVATNVGRGVEATNDSVLNMQSSSVSNNYYSGILVTNTSSATISGSTINTNGQDGVFFDLGSSGNVFSNVIDNNGILGTRGPTTGFNGIEVFTTWTGPSMVIHENGIYRSTTNGIFIGGGSGIVIANNWLFNNFVGATVFSSSPTSVTIRGNLVELPLAQGNEEGLLLDGSGVTVTVGGTAAGFPNTFKNILGNPSIHCISAPGVTCPAGGNVFQNSDLPIAGCPATCQQ